MTEPLLLPSGAFRWVTSWRTDVQQAHDGTELRASTISQPRASFAGSFFLGDADIRSIDQILSAGPAGTFELPLVHEAVAALAAVTSTTVLVDATYCDWLAIGRRVMIVGPAASFRDTITAVAGGTVTIGTGPVSGAYPAGVTHVYPLEDIRLEDGEQTSRWAVNAGQWAFRGRQATVRAIGGAGAALATFGGFVVMDRRPLLDGSVVGMQSMGGVRFLDSGGAFTSLTSWERSKQRRAGMWKIAGPADRQWWKAFAAAARGRRRAFLRPTWYPDLTVHTQPTGATALLRVVEDYSGEWFPSLAHRRLQVEYADGSIAYVAVASVTTGVGYDELALTAPFPGAIPGGSIAQISFLETVRLDADDVAIEYTPGWVGRVSLTTITVGDSPEPVAVPPTFPWTPSFEIYRAAEGYYDASLDIAARMITPATTRYLSTTGSDAADGLSWATAKRSMASVVASLSATAVAIYVAAGDYRGALGGWGGGVPYLYQDCNIIAVGGRARFSISPSGLTWAPNVTYPSTYQVTTTAPYAAIDEASVDADGVPLYLTSRASVALVDANPGSYYASGGVLYVRTVDSRAPDASIHSFVAGVTNGFALNNVNVYVQDCDFIGGNRSWFSSDCLAFTAVRCGFYFGELDCYRSQSTADGVLVDCVTHAAWSGDGCSYDANGNHLELRHTAIRNGNGTVGTCNGSSAHGATMIRLSGYYANSDGPNAADVVDSRGFGAGLEMERNRATSTSQQVNYAVDGFATSAHGWLLDCTLGGQVDGIAHDLRPIDAADRIYVRETVYSGVSGSGLVLAWLSGATFDEDEDLGGDPVELYTFTGPGQVWRYTSDSVDCAHDGNTYTAIAISRSDLPGDGTSDPEALVVRVPGTVDVSMDYGFGTPYRSLELEVVRLQTNGEAAEIWSGPVPNIAPDGDFTDLRCPSLLADRLQADAPGSAFQRQCNNRLFDPGCGVTKAAPRVIASAVSAISLDGYTVTVSTVGGEADGYFARGSIIRDDDGEARMIVSQVGSVLTLQAPFRALAAADDLTLEAGCDGAPETCRDKFANIDAFTGHFVPVTRLFRNNLHSWRG